MAVGTTPNTLVPANLQVRDRRARGIIGDTPAMEKLYAVIAKAAQSTHPVLILGESGTGKEVVARAFTIRDRSGTSRLCPWTVPLWFQP